MKSTLIKFLCTFLLTIFLCLISSAIWGLFVKWLWNWLMVKIFALPVITWIEAWGLCFLSSCLFAKTTIEKEK